MCKGQTSIVSLPDAGHLHVYGRDSFASQSVFYLVGNTLKTLQGQDDPGGCTRQDTGHLFAQFKTLHNFTHMHTQSHNHYQRQSRTHSHSTHTGLPLYVSGCLSDSPFAVRVIQAPTSSLCSPCSAHISISPLPTHILLISQSFQTMRL